MTAPARELVASTWGYHPAVNDAEEIVRDGRFSDLMIFGQRVPDVVDLVDEARLAAPPTQLPAGVYWFSGLERPTVLVVFEGSLAAPSVTMPIGAVPDGSALDNALGWVKRRGMTRPRFPVPGSSSVSK